MVISELEKFYKIEKYYDMHSKAQKRVKNQFEVWSLDDRSGRQFPRQFMCIIEMVGQKFKIVPDKRLKHVDKYFTFAYARVEGLMEYIKKYVDSLQYHSDYYYPNFRPHVFTELVVSDFLKNLGFKCNVGNGCDHWLLDEKNIYGSKSSNVSLTIFGLDMLSDVNEIQINYNIDFGSWISIKCDKNVDSIIEALNNLLKPLFLTDGVTNIQKSDKLEFTDFNGVKNSFDARDISLKSEEYKEEVRGKLLEMANSIK